MYIYIYIYVHEFVFVYIYIYRESLEVVLDVGGLGGLRAFVRELALQAPQRVRVQLHGVKTVRIQL